MPPGRRVMATRRAALAGCIVLGIAVRAGRLLERPFLHSDAPAYLRMAEDELRPDRWRSALTGYFPPLFPAAIRLVHTTGLDWEASARTVTFVAGVATVPLVARLGTRTIGPAVGLGAAALAAVHPRLVRVSTDILPEGLLGLVVVCWALLVTGVRSNLALAVAGALGGLGALIRPEGIVLAPLAVIGAAVGAPQGLRLRRCAAAVAGAAVTLVPLMLVLHASRGTWTVSGKEAAFVGRKYGVPVDSLLALVLDYPAAFTARYARNVVHQLANTATTLDLLLLLPFALAVIAPGVPTVRGARATVLATLAFFTLGIAVNPGRRYAVALVPLCLPWVAQGARLLAAQLPRLGRIGAPATTRRALGGAVFALLIVRALETEPSRQPCYRRTCAWLAERGYAGATMMADDARLAWYCGARFVLRPHRLRGKGKEAMALAREQGAQILVVPAVEVQGGGGPAEPPLFENCQGKWRMDVYPVSGSGG